MSGPEDPSRPQPLTDQLRTAFRRSPRLAVAFVLAAAIVLFFLVRIVVDIAGWGPPGDEPIRPWMTVGYIGQSWDISPRLIDEVGGLPLPIDHPLTLQEIADQRGVPVEDIIAIVDAAIAEIRAEGLTETPPPPGAVR